MNKDQEIQNLKDQLLQANFDLVRAGKNQEKWAIREQQLQDDIVKKNEIIKRWEAAYEKKVDTIIQLRAENNKPDYDLGDPKYRHLLS